MTEQRTSCGDPTTAAASLLVLEADATWPSLVRMQGEAPGRRIVVAQDTWRSPNELAERVVTRLHSLAARGHAVALGVIACGDRCDGETLRARAVIARALIRTLAGSPGSRLVITLGQPQLAGTRDLVIAFSLSLDQLAKDARVTLTLALADSD